MGSYKEIGLSHEMGLIDTPPLLRLVEGQGHTSRSEVWLLSNK